MPTPKTKRTTVPSAVEEPRAKSTPKKGTYPNPAYGLTLIILLLTTALVIGGMSVFWKDSILRQARKEMDARYMKLVQEMKGQAVATEEKTVADSHPLPTWEESGPLNSDPANTTVEYSNPEKGLASIDLPYNEAWGNASLTVMPFAINDTGDRVFFGPYIQVVGISREMKLDFIPVRSSSVAMKAAAQEANINSSDGGAAPILRIFPSVTYVKFITQASVEGGAGKEAVVEVIGTKANYRLSSHDINDLPELERIARTIQFAK
jgi:hypothetical protein